MLVQPSVIYVPDSASLSWVFQTSSAVTN